jgi:acetylornithine aminotransferase
MTAVELGRDVAREVAEGALQRGLLVNDATPSVLRLTPPLVISDAQIDEAIGILSDAWQGVAA